MKLVRSPNPEKKWRAEFDDGTHTDFGQANADDYLLTGDKDARMRFRIRHKKDLQTRDPKRAGYLSYYLLWGESTSLAENLAAYKRRFNL